MFNNTQQQSTQQSTQQSNQENNRNNYTPFFCQAIQQRSFFDIINDSSAIQDTIFFDQNFKQSINYFQYENQNENERRNDKKLINASNVTDTSDNESIINGLKEQNFDYFQQDQEQVHFVSRQKSWMQKQSISHVQKNRPQQSSNKLPYLNALGYQQKSDEEDDCYQSLQISTSSNSPFRESMAQYCQSIGDYPQTIFEQDYSKMSIDKNETSFSHNLSQKPSQFCESVVKQFSSDFNVFNKSTKKISNDQSNKKIAFKKEVKFSLKNQPSTSQLNKKQIEEEVLIKPAQSEGITSRPVKFQFKLKKPNTLAIKKEQISKELKIVQQNQIQQSQKIKKNDQIEKIQQKQVNNIKLAKQNEQKPNKNLQINETKSETFKQQKKIPNIPKISFKFNLKKSRVLQKESTPKDQVLTKKLTNIQQISEPIEIKQKQGNKQKSFELKEINQVKEGKEAKKITETKEIKVKEVKTNNQQHNLPKPETQRPILKKFSFFNNNKSKQIPKIKQNFNQKEKVENAQSSIKCDSKAKSEAGSLSSEDSMIDTKGITEQVKKNQIKENKMGKFEFKKSVRVFNNAKNIQKEDKVSKSILLKDTAQKNIIKKQSQQKNQIKPQKILINPSITTPKIIKNSLNFQNYNNNFQKTQKQKRSKSNSNEKLFQQMETLFQMRNTLKIKREKLIYQYSELYSFASSVSKEMKEKLGRFMD